MSFGSVGRTEQYIIKNQTYYIIYCKAIFSRL